MAPSAILCPGIWWDIHGVMRGAMEQISGEPLCRGGWMLCDARRRFSVKSDPNEGGRDEHGESRLVL